MPATALRAFSKWEGSRHATQFPHKLRQGIIVL